MKIHIFQNKFICDLKKKNIIGLVSYAKYFLLPAMVSIFPTLVYFGNNSGKLTPNYLLRPIILYLFIALVIYLLFLVIYRGTQLRAANAAFIFMVFFNFYSILEESLIRLDWFPVHFYTTIPLALVLVYYSIWLLNNLNDSISQRFWKIALLIFTGLVLFNLVTVINVKLTTQRPSDKSLSGPSQADPAKLPSHVNNPDIYYIVFDEFSGFQPMRDYWHNSKVDEFTSFLKSKNFEVIEDSHGSSIYTVQQMAIRLNYQKYNLADDEFSDPEISNEWYNAISDNRVVNYLKKQGYTTITFFPFRFANFSAQTMKSDVTYSIDDVPSTALNLYFDDFWILVADKTMLKELSPIYKKLSSDPHSNFIFFTLSKVGSLEDASSPKFVYAHLLLPHSPYLFDENGNQNLPSVYLNNAYYLGNYNYTMKLAQKLVEDILDSTDPKNPPVIILQSDHGFRNFYSEGAGGFKGYLENFPEEFKTSILYARLIPGYTPTQSAQESDPINTFPILFNFLFDAGIPLQ